MRFAAVSATILAQVLLLGAFTGCKMDRAAPDRSAQLGRWADFMPAQVQILPLTELATDDSAGRLRVYVGAFDSFDTQMKAPGTFRFELYEHLPRSPEPRGSMLRIWPDVDLTGARANHEHWRDFIRAYEFNLDFEPAPGRRYLLKVTYLSPNQRRLTDQFALEYQP